MLLPSEIERYRDNIDGVDQKTGVPIIAILLDMLEKKIRSQQNPRAVDLDDVAIAVREIGLTGLWNRIDPVKFRDERLKGVHDDYIDVFNECFTQILS